MRVFLSCLLKNTFSHNCSVEEVFVVSKFLGVVVDVDVGSVVFKYIIITPNASKANIPTQHSNLITTRFEEQGNTSPFPPSSSVHMGNECSAVVGLVLSN